MRTTVDLPDELMTSLKVKAAEEGKKLKTLVEEALRQFLFPEEDQAAESASEANGGWSFPTLPPHEMDDEAVLLRQETDAVEQRVR